jgi:hypothetical protein
MMCHPELTELVTVNTCETLETLVPNLDLADAWTNNPKSPIYTHFTARGAVHVDRMGCKKRGHWHATNKALNQW